MADVTLEELYKSLQAADAAGDKPAAQQLADYIRMLSAMPPGTDINKTSGAPMGVRAAVGAASTEQDKLSTLRKFFPDAQQYDKDNFIYTDPKTRRPTLMNENNPVFFGIPLPTMGDIAGAAPEIAEFVGSGLGATLMSPFGPPGMVGGAATGGTAFKKLYEMGMQYGGPTVETRPGLEQAAGTAKDITVNALGQRFGQFVEAGLPKLLTPIQERIAGIRQGIPQAAARQNIPLPAGVATQSPAIQRVEAGLLQTPGGAQVIAPMYSRMAEAMGTRATEIAEQLSRAVKGPGVTPGVVLTEKGGLGKFVQEGADAAGKRFAQRREQLDDIVSNAVGPQNRFPATNTAQLVADLEAQIAKSPETYGPMLRPVIDRAMRVVTDAQSGFGGVPFEALRQMRTAVGKELERPDISGLTQSPTLARLYDALRRDVVAAADQSGDIAGRGIRLHDRYVRFNREVNLPALQRIVDQDLDVAAANMALSGTKDGIGRLQLLRRNFKPDEWDTVSASVWQQLGNAKAGVKEGAELGASSYQFSPTTFLTNWMNLSDSAKMVLFAGERYRNIIPAMNDLVKVATGSREAGKMVNTSNTAGAQMVTSALLGGGGLALGGAAGMDAASALLGGAASLSGLVLTSNTAARLLESPRFIRWVSDTSRAVVNNPNSLSAQIGKLLAIGQAEPGMKDAIDTYYKQIKSVTGK
jgi:hypothetical protein